MAIPASCCELRKKITVARCGFVLLLAGVCASAVLYHVFFVLPARYHLDYHASSARSRTSFLKLAWPPLSVVFWTPFFGNRVFDGVSYTNDSCAFPTDLTHVPHPGPTTVWCKLSHVRDQDRQKALDSASMLVFHVRDTRAGELPSRRLFQPWVITTMEAPISDFLFAHDTEHIVLPERMRQISFHRIASTPTCQHLTPRARVCSIASVLRSLWQIFIVATQSAEDRPPYYGWFPTATLSTGANNT